MKLYEIIKFENWFLLMNTFRGNPKRYELKYYLEKYNVENYWIYKGSHRFKSITLDELLDEKYSQYIFFHKDYYNKNEIDKSIEILYENLKLQLNYLNKPLPKFEMLQKIKIIEKI